MNTTMKTIIDENNMKFNYFKLLVDRNKINLSADLVVAKIKPKFNSVVSTSYFLNNILNIVLIKKLLFNFSRNVRDIKYNKMLNNFENLIKFNRPLFEKTILEEIKEALDNTKISIPPKYHQYIINVRFGGNYIFNITQYLINSCNLCVYKYMTPTQYKKYVLKEIKEYISNPELESNNDIIEYFKCAFDYRQHYYKTNSSNPIQVKFYCKYENVKEIESLKHSNKLHLLLMK